MPTRAMSILAGPVCAVVIGAAISPWDDLLQEAPMPSCLDIEDESSAMKLTSVERAELQRAVKEAAIGFNELVERSQPGEGDGLPALRRALDALSEVSAVIGKVEGALGARLQAIEADPEQVNLGPLAGVDREAASAYLTGVEAAGVWRLLDEGLAPGRWLRRADGDLAATEVFEDLFARGLDYRVAQVARVVAASLRLNAAAGDEPAAEAAVRRGLGLARAREAGFTATDVAFAGSIRLSVCREIVNLGQEGLLKAALRTRLAAILDADASAVAPAELAMKGEWLFMRGSAAAGILREAEELTPEEQARVDRYALHVKGVRSDPARGPAAGPEAAVTSPWDGLPRANERFDADQRRLVKDMEWLIKRGRSTGLMWNRAARLIIALEDYREKRGAYPEALGALAPEFIAELPVDPVAERPFGYRLLKDDPHGRGFVLYSLWLDQEDQRGKMGEDARLLGYPEKDTGYDFVLNQPREPKKP